eukprot:scaffold39033_cov55-Phaeocystis_antarctica.AAC.1
MNACRNFLLGDGVLLREQISWLSLRPAEAPLSGRARLRLPPSSGQPRPISQPLGPRWPAVSGFLFTQACTPPREALQLWRASSQPAYSGVPRPWPSRPRIPGEGS